MQHTRRNLLYVSMIFIIAVLPAAMGFGWYQYSRDPNFRPLGLTREALRDYGVPGLGVDLIAYVDWPASEADHPARKKLAANLMASFASKGVEVRLVFRESNGPAQISYVIGNSTIGPYPVSRAAEGISMAVEAYRMN